MSRQIITTAKVLAQLQADKEGHGDPKLTQLGQLPPDTTFQLEQRDDGRIVPRTGGFLTERLFGGRHGD